MNVNPEVVVMFVNGFAVGGLTTLFVTYKALKIPWAEVERLKNG